MEQSFDEIGSVGEVKMDFQKEYTITLKVSKESDFLKTLDAKSLDDYSKILKTKDDKLEKDKILLSNDAFALGSMLKLLSNTWRNK